MDQVLSRANRYHSHTELPLADKNRTVTIQYLASNVPQIDTVHMNDYTNKTSEAGYNKSLSA